MRYFILASLDKKGNTDYSLVQFMVTYIPGRSLRLKVFQVLSIVDVSERRMLKKLTLLGMPFALRSLRCLAFEHFLHREINQMSSFEIWAG